MNTTDIIKYTELGFDNNKYLSLQKDHILERINKFNTGNLYLEIGGKFLFDAHASRVLPGFLPDNKKQIFLGLKDISDIIFCVSAEGIANNRQLKNTNESYQDVVIAMLKDIKEQLDKTPYISINLCSTETDQEVNLFVQRLNDIGYKSYKRYKINGYPHNLDAILGKNGYKNDEYIPVNNKLILVTGAASNSGKMSTCLGQMYIETINGTHSGYAKYETFPIWNLPLNHPVNLAYEAATVDIGDYNVIDHYHKAAYNQESVNYNRDVEAFEIVKTLANKFVEKDNFMRMYKSPTDMGINYAGFALTDDKVISIASMQEIQRRKSWYQEVIDRGQGNKNWLTLCDNLIEKATCYLEEKGYSIKA